MKKPKSIIRKVEELGEIITEITFECPIRGLVTQKVKGVKFKSLVTNTPKYTSEEFLNNIIEARSTDETESF